MKKKKVFINVWDYYDPNYPWQIFIGGRGTGKTFSGLQGWIDRRKDVYGLYLRRTLKELESVVADQTDGNPFNDLYLKLGRKYKYVFESQATYLLSSATSLVVADESKSTVYNCC